jgi:hypothetical protein
VDDGIVFISGRPFALILAHAILAHAMESGESGEFSRQLTQHRRRGQSFTLANQGLTFVEVDDMSVAQTPNGEL